MITILMLAYGGLNYLLGLDPVLHLIILAFDLGSGGAVVLAIVEHFRKAKWVDLADHRREVWFAEHPVSTASTSDGDDGA